MTVKVMENKRSLENVKLEYIYLFVTVICDV